MLIDLTAVLVGGVWYTEQMFEVESIGTVEDIAELGDAGLVDAAVGALRLERAASARRLYAIAQLFWRREKEQAAEERAQWRIDGWDAVAAEVSAAQAISRAKASGQIQLGVCIWEDLPKTARIFEAGWVDYWVMNLIQSRISLLSKQDRARIDGILARSAARWNRLSRNKLIEKIDYWVTHVDSLAQRTPRNRDEDRHVGFGPDRDGVAEMWGSVRSPSAAAMDARLDSLAETVCKADPRSKQQRRADALEALAACADRMACLCGTADCAAGAAPASPVLITVVADATTVNGTSSIPGYVPGYGALPAELVRLYVRTAKLQQVHAPSELVDCEQGYRPSAGLATFVRLRDLSCRFPGCEAPASVCDLDHTVPWPYGPTHASNLKLLCRHHHLVKTFYIGVGGWSEVQKPDGTVVWTAPTGHKYTTKPGGALFFPQLAVPTAKIVLPKRKPKPEVGRNLIMPTRSRTRAAERQYRVDYERALNYKRIYLDVDPPPF